jgi:hypothetical protein
LKQQRQTLEQQLSVVSKQLEELGRLNGEAGRQ